MKNEILGFFKEYRFLSNYHICKVYYENIMYPSTEHAYQAAKTKHSDERHNFVHLTCKEARLYGQKIILRNDFAKVRNKLMYDVNMIKFTNNEDIKKLLIDTENSYLEETNKWHDNYWGNCICEKCGGKGLNNLGKTLMEIRGKLI